MQDRQEMVQIMPFSVKAESYLNSIHQQADAGGYSSRSENKMGGKYWEKRIWSDMTHRYIQSLLDDYPQQKQEIELYKTKIEAITRAKEQAREFLSFDEVLSITYKKLLGRIHEEKKMRRDELQDLLISELNSLRYSFANNSESDFVKASQVLQTITDQAAALNLFSK